MEKLSIRTNSKVEFQDITGMVEDAVRSSGVRSGVCQVFVPHTTAGITLNEHADPSVIEDIITRLEALVPQRGDYRHGEGNSPAHIKSSLTGSSVTLFVENGGLVLGIWQGVFFCEFDGPRTRQVMVRITPG